MIDKYLLSLILAIVLTAVCQVMMKLGAQRAGKAWRIYLNVYTLSAYATLVVVTLLSLYAYREIPLKVGAMLTPLNLILVGIFSSWLLRERLTRKQIIGAVVVLIGMAVFNFPEDIRLL